ncbi:MAG: hypothetical protein WCG97_03440 [bacterium]
MKSSPEAPEQAPIETGPNYEMGTNVTIRIDLLRHPEKEYNGGHLTEDGKKALTAKLNAEFQDGEFDTVKCYASPLMRGQESMAPIQEFLDEHGIKTITRTKTELAGRATEMGKGLKDALGPLLAAEDAKYVEVPDDNPERAAYEPANKDFETRANHLLLRDFFDKNYPDSPIGGREVGQEVDSLIQHIAEMAAKMNSGSKVKFVLISHSGVVEYLTKLLYLQNHSDLKPEEVTADMIGGLMNYMEGPQISITSDEAGKQKAVLRLKDMILDYELK